MFTDIQQQTLDIDWFFINDNKIGFVASGGGKLPNSVTNLDEKIGVISSYFRNLPDKSKVIINNKLEEIKGSTITENYLSDFVYMAKRGLYVFDKSSLNNFSDLNYHLVVKPESPLELEKLPSDIFQMINKTIYTGNIEQIDSITINDIQ
ncbi:hypothetical protein GKZ90_0025530 [Flavobacterium sp. MC2016-06]|jgi:hypothetical protein|uniref:hypothetical protein n=1 Tax=Flavobacterium sp. MC2016-06 TaxID=2676308 RepID=UPI0012BAFD67|nr:hypothetical protein [Flavobacterium sp. MC2016-06]MBU3862492.1 hypothetical protein [Flavobacterium sp. MC2016-06]